MSRERTRWSSGLALVVVLCLGSGAVDTQTPDDRPRRIALWGSSVPNGTGDELNKGGYTGRLRELIEPRGWEVLNQSRGGDNTITITPRFEPDDTPDPDTRYLTTVEPGYVVIALSLGNEGIMRCAGSNERGCAPSREAADAIYQQFADGLQRLVRRSREAGIEPIVTLPYARGDFNEAEYAYTRQMNLLINTWDVPSVNLLGAVDDGHGRWARGFWPEPIHPNAAGHTEMFHAFVPSLFDAMAEGKPTPKRSTDTGFVRVRGDAASPLRLDVDDTMRSFGLTFSARRGGDGTLASVGGQTLDHTVNWVTVPSRRGVREFEAMTLIPTGERFLASVSVEDGRWAYVSASGNAVSTPIQETVDQWHQVTLTHYVARGQTDFYVDGRLVGTIDERIQPDRFVLGGAGPVLRGAEADYKDWMVHRAGLNSDEVAALHAGTLLQASLELYAPLSDATFENRAQSLSAIRVDSRVVAVTDE